MPKKFWRSSYGVTLIFFIYGFALIFALAAFLSFQKVFSPAIVRDCIERSAGDANG